MLIANSGVTEPNPQFLFHPPAPTPDNLEEIRKVLWSISEEDFSFVLQNNVMGSYYTVVAFLPLLDAANKRQPPPTSGTIPPPRAQVIVTWSIAAWIRVVYPSLPYIVSKAALTQMVKSLSTTFAPHDIRVNGIAPGVYATENVSNIYGDYEHITSYGSIPRDLIPSYEDWWG